MAKNVRFWCYGLLLVHFLKSSSAYSNPELSIRAVHKNSFALQSNLNVVDSELELIPDHFSSSAKVILECNSSTPVEWIFNGPFYWHYNALLSPKYLTIRGDNGLNPAGPGTTNPNTFSAQIVFQRFQKRGTGSYVCRHLQDFSSNSAVYTYFSDPADPFFFVSGGRGAETEFTLFVSPYDRKVTLPLFSSLYRPMDVIQPSRLINGTTVPLSFGPAVQYHSRAGLTLNFTSEPESRVHGVYFFAIPGSSRITLRVKYVPNMAVRGTPVAIYLGDPDTVLDDMEFKCWGMTNLTLTNIWWAYFNSTYDYNPDGGGLRPYSVAWNVSRAELQAMRPDQHFGCVEAEYREDVWFDGFTHFWRMSDEPIPPHPTVTFSLDTENSNYSCCTNSLSQAPVLEATRCNTVTECRMQHIETRVDVGNPPPFTQCQYGSALSDQFPETYGRVISCFHRRVGTFDMEDFNKNEGLTIFSTHNRSALHIPLDIGGALPDNPIIPLQAISCGGSFRCDGLSITVTQLPQRKPFICIFSGFHFSHSIHFGVEYRNGTLIHVSKNHDFTSSVFRDNYVQLGSDFLFESDDIVRLYCFGPRWDSYEWHNMTVGINYQVL